MKSMTGYGNSEMQLNQCKVSIEARSENHRFLDIKFQLPDCMLQYEQKLLELVKGTVTRGKVRITISLIQAKRISNSINMEAAQGIFANLQKLKSKFGIEEGIKIDHFLYMKEIFNYETNNKLTKAEYNKILTHLKETIDKLDKNRISEGRNLRKDFNKRIARLEVLINNVNKKRAKFTKELKKRVKERIQTIFNDIKIDDDKLYQEVAILLERSDFTEEIVRIKAHLSKIKEKLNSKGPIGKEIDFLLQELNREAGTISAKAKDAHISHSIIEFRSEIEKMREQSQNIE